MHECTTTRPREADFLVCVSGTSPIPLSFFARLRSSPAPADLWRWVTQCSQCQCFGTESVHVCELCMCDLPFFSQASPQSLQCGVCLQMVRKDALLSLPCQHSFCKSCWEQHCTVLVKDGVGVGECLGLYWGVKLFEWRVSLLVYHLECANAYFLLYWSNYDLELECRL